MVVTAIPPRLRPYHLPRVGFDPVYAATTSLAFNRKPEVVFTAISPRSYLYHLPCVVFDPNHAATTPLACNSEPDVDLDFAHAATTSLARCCMNSELEVVVMAIPPCSCPYRLTP